ncbi:MAG: CBS domain-containing protein [Desulforhopalus sp.]
MKNFQVKDLMVPISEYAAVTIGTSLIDAVKVLEKAQEAYTTSKYQHRAILVLDEDGKIVGKISQLRALKAIESDFKSSSDIERLKKFNFTDTYIAQLRDLYRSHGKVMSKHNLHEASMKKVEEFMQAPTPGEYVSEDSSLDTAIHKLVAGTHLSLLVTHGEKIVGVLRISDVFAAVFHEMTALEEE